MMNLALLLRKLRLTAVGRSPTGTKGAEDAAVGEGTSIDGARYDFVILILLEGCGWRPGGSDILWDASGR